QQGVVGHHPVGPLHDQVEDPVVVPGYSRAEERDVAEDHPQAHQRESRGEAHHDRDHDEPQHGQTERGGAHGPFPPLPSGVTVRWRAASSIAFAESMATRLDSSSTYLLFDSCVSITSISSTSESRDGQVPVRRHSMQRTISASPCTVTRAPAIGTRDSKWHTG